MSQPAPALTPRSAMCFGLCPGDNQHEHEIGDQPRQAARQQQQEEEKSEPESAYSEKLAQPAANTENDPVST